MFDHVHLRVADLAESRRFYEIVMRPLGFAVTGETPALVELGPLTLSEEEPRTEHLHLAFLARTRVAVEVFHRAGVEAGFRDNGVPGLRPYAPDYYAAYLLDPDGHNVEAVHRSAETRARWSWLRWEP